MALLSSVHDALPQIYLITDGSVDDEHNICQTMKTEITNRGSKSPRISTFGLGNILECFQKNSVHLKKNWSTSNPLFLQYLKLDSILYATINSLTNKISSESKKDL